MSRLSAGRAIAIFLDWAEAAVDEDDGFVFEEDDVGAAGEVFGVEAEAVAHVVKEGADEELGFGVFGFDPTHVP